MSKSMQSGLVPHRIFLGLGDTVDVVALFWDDVPWDEELRDIPVSSALVLVVLMRSESVVPHVIEDEGMDEAVSRTMDSPIGIQSGIIVGRFFMPKLTLYSSPMDEKQCK